MDPLIELITNWQAYSRKAVRPNVRDFCTHQLSRKTKSESGGVKSDLFFAKQLGRMNSLLKQYYKIGLRQISEIELDWYYFLDAVENAGEIRKHDIVSIAMLGEPTTGIDILNRMVKAGLLKERTDPADGRARLISLSAKGRKTFLEASVLFNQITRGILHEMRGELKAEMASTFGKIIDSHLEKIREDREGVVVHIEKVVGDYVSK